MRMPRKMSGRAIRMIDELMVAIRIPRVVFDKAIHLYPPPWASGAAGVLLLVVAIARPLGALALVLLGSCVGALALPIGGLVCCPPGRGAGRCRVAVAGLTLPGVTRWRCPTDFWFTSTSDYRYAASRARVLPWVETRPRARIGSRRFSSTGLPTPNGDRRRGTTRPLPRRGSRPPHRAPRAPRR